MFKIITIPFDREAKCFNDDLLNRFVLSKKVTRFMPEFFQDGEEKYWTVFLQYDTVIEKKGKAEEDGELDESQRMLLKRLKEWRINCAEKEGVPVYIIGTNREFIDIVKNRPESLEALRAIRGFGKAKVARYGSSIVEIIRSFYEKR
jgi:superfamily II DNA helicase RecQ